MKCLFHGSFLWESTCERREVLVHRKAHILGKDLAEQRAEVYRGEHICRALTTCPTCAGPAKKSVYPHRGAVMKWAVGPQLALEPQGQSGYLAGRVRLFSYPGRLPGMGLAPSLWQSVES